MSDTIELDREAGAVSPACHRLDISVSHRSPSRTFYRAICQGEELLTNWEPVYSACRALLARGITGQLEVWHEGAMFPALKVDIERGAGLAMIEGDRSGLAVTKWRPFERADDGAPSE